MKLLPLAKGWGARPPREFPMPTVWACLLIFQPIAKTNFAPRWHRLAVEQPHYLLLTRQPDRVWKRKVSAFKLSSKLRLKSDCYHVRIARGKFPPDTAPPRQETRQTQRRVYNLRYDRAAIS